MNEDHHVNTCTCVLIMLIVKDTFMNNYDLLYNIDDHYGVINCCCVVTVINITIDGKSWNGLFYFKDYKPSEWFYDSPCI